MRKLTLVSLLMSLLGLVTAFVFAGCTAPADLSVGRDGDGFAVIAWGATNALGLYVTSPDAKLPGGPEDKVEGGHVYWVLEATTFPTGFGSPVTYQTIPPGAKEETAKHGGIAGGESLEKGVQYKFGVVSTGGQLTVEEVW
jgi:hypothetical protein